MRASKINSSFSFDDNTWLVHLVNCAPVLASVFTGGHAAMIVEGRQGDNIFLCLYDILAQKNSLNPLKPSFVSSVRILRGLAYVEDEAQVEALYKDPRFRSSAALSYPLEPTRAADLHQHVFRDQQRVAEGIARAFVDAANGKSPDELDKYFAHCDELAKYHTTVVLRSKHSRTTVMNHPFDLGGAEVGLKPINKFIRHCAAFLSQQPKTENDHANFLKLVWSMEKFSRENLLKLYNDGLFADHIPFRLCGPGLFTDRRTPEERAADGANLNCMRWCKESLKIAAGVDVIFPSDNPKVVNVKSSGCRIL